MNTHEQDDPRLEPLLREMRQMGTAHSEEPDSRYFANFRMRVMNEIELRESKRLGFFVRFSQWIAEKPLRSGIIGFSTCAVILLGVYLNQDSSAPKPIADAQPQLTAQGSSSQSMPKLDAPVMKPSAPIKPQGSTQQQMAQTTTVDTADVFQSASSKELAATIDSSLAKSSPEELAENLQATAGAPSITTSEKDVPVSLSDLSESELEVVLHTLEQSN